MSHEKMAPITAHTVDSDTCNDNLSLLALTASRMTYWTPNQMLESMENPSNIKDELCLCKDRIGRLTVKEEKHLTYSKHIGKKKSILKSGNTTFMEEQMKKERVARRATFVVKLMKILLDDTNQDIITWCNKGEAFSITNPEEFVQCLLPNTFKQAKFESFTRKLYRWGFRRVANASNNTTFHHSLFLRDKPFLCLKMRSGNIVSSNVVIFKDPFHNAR